tara:strand:- start:509 stop:667 length:159 start_codon:yes stop_codon:yes gene_type:complete
MKEGLQIKGYKPEEKTKDDRDLPIDNIMNQRLKNIRKEKTGNIKKNRLVGSK